LAPARVVETEEVVGMGRLGWLLGQLGPDAVKVGGAHVAPGDCASGEGLDGGHVVDGDWLFARAHFANERSRHAQSLGQLRATAILFVEPVFKFFHAAYFIHGICIVNTPGEILFYPL
jgi:hypothetical protein